MRGAMAVSWRGLALLLLLGVCSVPLSAASALPCDGLNGKSQDYTSGSLRHRSLLQAVSTTAPVPPPSPSPTPAPRIAPSPKVARSSSTTQAKTYLMWVGVGAAIFIAASVAVFCLCRKFGQNRIRRAQRLPPLPRYH